MADSGKIIGIDLGTTNLAVPLAAQSTLSSSLGAKSW